MSAIEIKPGIYWVGAKDWNVRDFHGYQTQRGTSYNAYLIIDKKKVLIDTVKSSHRSEMLERIKSVIDPSEIDIIVSNHVEMDHSGTIPQIVQLAPNAEIITSVNGMKGLSEHYDIEGWKIRAVKSGETLNIGDKCLQFVHTPMVHWPDSMVTYIPEEKLLLPNDAFGQHIAYQNLFDDENPQDIIFHEAAKYYANIVYPYGSQVKKALDSLSSLKIEMIAPSHGVIWRKHIGKIVEKYSQWSNYDNKNQALVIYDSMWGSTEQLAHAVKSAFEENEVPVLVRCLKSSHISDIITDILETKYVIIGSATLNNTILPTMGAFITYLKGLIPRNKIGLSFGSYGWNPKALQEIQGVMEKLGWSLPFSPFNVKYRPNLTQINELKGMIKNIVNQQD